MFQEYLTNPQIPIIMGQELSDSSFMQKTYADIESKGKNVKVRNYSQLQIDFLEMLVHHAIEAYKNALRNNPSDLETKYNLSYAMNLLEKQQNQQQQQQNQQQGQGDNSQENQQNQNQQQQQQQEQQEQQQQQAKQEEAKKEEENKISPEDAERILQALENEEKEVNVIIDCERTRKNYFANCKIKFSRNLIIFNVALGIWLGYFWVLIMFEIVYFIIKNVKLVRR